MEVELGTFDYSTLQLDSVYVLSGRRRSGKSVLMMFLIYILRRKFDYAYCVSPTYSTLKSLARCMPGACLRTRVNVDEIQEILDILEKMSVEGKLLPRVLIVLDDCMFDPKFLKSETFKNIHNNGRHWNVTLITTAQYIIDYPKGCRSMVDYVFSFDEPIPENREMLFNCFFGCLRSFNNFDGLMSAVCKQHTCLVLKNTSGITNWRERIARFKAPEKVPDFKFGSRKFWKAYYKGLKKKEKTNNTNEIQIKDKRGNETMVLRLIDE